MKTPKTNLLLALLLTVFSVHTYADITLAPLFCDNAVLQREKPVPVWGRADAGEKVTVTFGSQKVSTTAGTDGRWIVTLAAMPAAAKPANLIAKGKNTVTVRGVLVGEVWLCSGQSNMEFAMRQGDYPRSEITSAKYPLIRYFKTARASKAEPQDTATGRWFVCGANTVGGFSAVAYYFARELYQTLNIPIGLVASAWDGSQIESWTNIAEIGDDPARPAVEERWAALEKSYPQRAIDYEKALAKWTEAGRIAQQQGKPNSVRRPWPLPALNDWPQRPGSIYNGMISPLLPYALRGVLWYQGEANATRYTEYRTLFPSMIRQWRAAFKQGDIPFYYVQLAAYGKGAKYPWQREAQRYALKLPATGEALAIDIGDENDIHPKNKLDVGRRLALIARANVYNEKIEFSGPVYNGITKENDTLRIAFTHAAGLKTKDPALPGFEIAAADRKFVPAKARIEGETVVVSAPGVQNPVAVRYAWAPFPPAPLYNSADLPASPFRSDNWDE